MSIKEVIGINEFGICPHCGKLMGMLESVYVMYGLTYNGAYPNRIFHRERNITYACTCGARYDMEVTSQGIVPKEYKFKNQINKTLTESNPIGQVEEKENES